MSFTDYGLIQLGSFIKGDSPSPPTHLEFGIGSSFFDGTKPNLDSGFMRAPITWRWSGTNPQGVAVLSTIDALGSNISEIGIGAGSSVGSTLYTRDLSAIGDKTSAFSVTLTFDIRPSRP
jgi:hypothetical protein